MLFQHSHPAGAEAKRPPFKKRVERLLIRYLRKYSENPTPFIWTKGPEHLQRIIEATKEYQMANPRQSKQRKVLFPYIKN